MRRPEHRRHFSRWRDLASATGLNRPARNGLAIILHANSAELEFNGTLPQISTMAKRNEPAQYCTLQRAYNKIRGREKIEQPRQKYLCLARGARNPKKYRRMNH